MFSVPGGFATAALIMLYAPAVEPPELTNPPCSAYASGITAARHTTAHVIFFMIFPVPVTLSSHRYELAKYANNHTSSASAMPDFFSTEIPDSAGKIGLRAATQIGRQTQ